MEFLDILLYVAALFSAVCGSQNDIERYPTEAPLVLVICMNQFWTNFEENQDGHINYIVQAQVRRSQDGKFFVVQFGIFPEYFRIFLATWLTTVSIMTTCRDSRARPRFMKWPMQLVRVAVFYFGVCWEWGRFSVLCAIVISVKVRQYLLQKRRTKLFVCI